MDVLSSLSSFLYWGESAKDEQDGTLTTPEDLNLAEVEEGLEEEEEWILVGKKGRSIKKKHDEKEEEEDPLPFPNEDYDIEDPPEEVPEEDPLPFPDEDYDLEEAEDEAEKEKVRYEYETYRDSLLRRPRKIISMEICNSDGESDDEDSDDEYPESFAPLFDQFLAPLPDKQLGCKPQLTKRPPMKELKRQVKTISRRNDRKSLKRTNQVMTRDVGAKRQKQQGRMHGKQGGKGGKRCGWH